MAEVFKTLSKSFIHRLGFLQLISIEKFSIFLLWLFTISSLIGISLGHLEWFITKTPINLMLGFLLLLINVPLGNGKGRRTFLVLFLAGMCIEILGVIRGDIFGVYHYGENLGFKVWGVPLMIGIYWAVLTTVTSQIARGLFNSLWTIAIVGASLMVGLDFLMEQLAHTFDFWHFTDGIAPFQNYVTWFLMAFALQILAWKFIPKGGSTFSFHLYMNQIVFFAVTFFQVQL